jgi:predicted Co/Zn/Cd cation transporter (cation efflux family)
MKWRLLVSVATSFPIAWFSGTFVDAHASLIKLAHKAWLTDMCLSNTFFFFLKLFVAIVQLFQYCAVFIHCSTLIQPMNY